MKASRLGTILWTLAAAVLVHGIVRHVGTDGLWDWTVGLVGSVVGDDPLRTRIADALVLGVALGLLPLLAGLRGRHPGEAAVELLAGVGLTAGAVVLAVAPLDAAVDALDNPLWVYVPAFVGLAVVAMIADGCAGRLRTLIGVELLKIWRGRLLRTGLLVAVLATLLAGWTHDPGPGESGWTRAAHALGVGFWTAEILVLVLGATMVAGEISQSTMKMILPYAYRRAEWIAAKSTVLVVCAAFFALLVVSTGVLHTSIDAGLGDVTREAVAGFGAEDEIEVFQTADVMRGRLADTATAATASLIASAMVGLLLSCLFQSLVPALSASFLVFAALKTGDIFLGFSKQTLDAIYAHYPDELRRLTENFGRALNESWNDALLPEGLILSLLTGILGLLVSLRLFGRRDLHG